MVYPENITYNINVSILNYTSLESGYCWYSNSLGTWNSTCVAAGTNWTNLVSIEGSNIWTVYCNDSANNINSSSITFFKDITFPTFSDYADNSGALTSSGTAWFNATILNTNGTVFLQINNANYTAPNSTANVYNVSVNLSSAGTYSYYWLSWGNGTNKNFNISTTRNYVVNSPSGDNGGGGGGGGGAATTGKTYVLTEEQFIAGATKNLQSGAKIKFTIVNDTHYVTLDSFTETTATITVESDPQTVTLTVGQEKKFDLTGDNYYDLSAKLESINYAGKLTTITVKSIYEAVIEEPSAPPATSKTPTTSTEPTVSPTEVSELESIKGNKFWIIVIITALIIAGVVLFFIFHKKQKKKKNK